MNILTLIIKQKYFDEILAGTKTQEFREIRPNTQKKYCELDEEGYCKEEDGILIPRKYDAIQFYVGYNKNRASALVEVKDAHIELLFQFHLVRLKGLQLVHRPTFLQYFNSI